MENLQRYGAGYVRENYDVTAKLTNTFISNDRNLINRLRNLLISAIKEETLLAKLIVVVPDDDLLKLFDEDWDDVEKAMKRVINEIMSSQTKLIQIQKDYLPKKSKRLDFPQIVWIEAPLHDHFSNNYMRQKFNKCLNTTALMHEGITVLQLKKIWDPTNTNLFIAESNRYTSEGLNTYWAAVDATVRFMDTILLNKLLMKGKKKPFKPKSTNMADGRNQFKWRSENFKKRDNSKYYNVPDRSREAPRRRLPEPPRRY